MPAQKKRKQLTKNKIQEKENSKENVPLNKTKGIEKSSKKKTVSFGENSTKLFTRGKEEIYISENTDIENFEIITPGPTLQMTSIFNIPFKTTLDTRKMTIGELKSALKSRGLSTSGTKKNLILRLEKELVEEGYENNDILEDEKNDNDDNLKNEKLKFVDLSPIKSHDLYFDTDSAFQSIEPVTFSDIRLISKSYKRKNK